MAKTSYFELNPAGVVELLQSPEMQGILANIASAKAAEAGEGYNSAVHVGAKRAYANVYAETHEAFVDNLHNNTLLKVVG